MHYITEEKAHRLVLEQKDHEAEVELKMLGRRHPSQ